MLRQQIPIQQFIANLPLFKGYAEADLERIAAGATRVHAQRGTVIFRRGEACNGMHAVLFGQLKLALHAMQGGERVIDLMGPGQTLGEAALFLDQPYIATAEALADTELVHISKATVLAEADRNPEFARRVMVNLSRRLYRRISDLESYTLCSATDRVVGYLLNDLPEHRAGQGVADAARRERRDRLAAEPHARTLFAHPARSHNRRPDRDGWPLDHDPERGRIARTHGVSAQYRERLFRGRGALVEHVGDRAAQLGIGEIRHAAARRHSAVPVDRRSNRGIQTWLIRGAQAALSPIFGAPPVPASWHFAQRACTTCSPVRSAAGLVLLRGSTHFPPDLFTM